MLNMDQQEIEEIPILVANETTDIKTETLSKEKFKPFSSTPNTTKKIPISIITGYLGSGKSTLLQQIAKNSNKKVAIILNEFGDSAIIEKSVTIQDQSESVTEWLDIGNGCLCCTVKDTGVSAIENLIENSKDKIDYILLETTGIADPAPIAQMFWLDKGLASNIYIDSVITVVDSKNIIKSLNDKDGHWHGEGELITTAHLQLALADVVLLNKIDQIENQDEVSKKIREINSTCPIYPTKFGDISIDKILDLHSFDVYNIDIAGTFHGAISTICLNFPFFNDVSQFEKFEKFLQYLLWESDEEIHRTKGLLVYNDDVRVVQGVRDTYEIIENGKLLDSVTENKLVLIGKQLDDEKLINLLNSYI
ncbi:unnamed protein product [Candida verbasci]|uniref:CobW/HypB/UreG nucleotide-binding domain-containing protein n=1 Tax=Candida verbasci TaxID=1227364 RepID=A0A9W4TZX9_9ASCO|nr:unnamed protein product [Candida verbasci]